jgi:hypothetical protein
MRDVKNLVLYRLCAEENGNAQSSQACLDVILASENFVKWLKES